MTCVGPSCRRALAIIVTSAPTNSTFSASSAVCTPVVQASEACTRSRSTPIQRSGSASSSEVDRCSDGSTVRVSRSMSGCMNRLNSTRPSAPAATSRCAMCPTEEKNGPIFTASGIVISARTASTSST